MKWNDLPAHSCDLFNPSTHCPSIQTNCSICPLFTCSSLNGRTQAKPRLCSKDDEAPRAPPLQLLPWHALQPYSIVSQSFIWKCKISTPGGERFCEKYVVAHFELSYDKSLCKVFAPCKYSNSAGVQVCLVAGCFPGAYWGFNKT